MKRKILMSIFVLMLTCFITLGCVGCDNTNPGTLTITGITAATPVAVEKTSGTTLEILEVKEAALASVTEIAFDSNGDADYDDDGDKKWTTDANGSAYSKFIKNGGSVNGFNISQQAGTYTFTFSYNGTTSENFQFTITEPAA